MCCLLHPTLTINAVVAVVLCLLSVTLTALYQPVQTRLEALLDLFWSRHCSVTLLLVIGLTGEEREVASMFMLASLGVLLTSLME